MSFALTLCYSGVLSQSNQDTINSQMVVLLDHTAVTLLLIMIIPLEWCLCPLDECKSNASHSF